MKKLNPKRIKSFQQEILDWYAKHRRDLPWREIPYDISLKQRDPYKILVSEVMLQQTQVGRVIPKYEAWLVKFPTVDSLAKANIRDVLQLWSGLGYNRRALYLQKTAQAIFSLYKGIWPRSIPELEALPGIGKYTARALACFAFNQQVAVVDTNIRKVILSQFYKTEEYKSISDNTIQEIADTLLPAGQAYEWNQALMDYAAVILKKEKIPISKQSKFQGSNRYYRGKLLRLLLEKETVHRSDIGILLKPGFSETDELWLTTLLLQMEKDGFISFKKETVMLL